MRTATWMQSRTALDRGCVGRLNPKGASPPHMDKGGISPYVTKRFPCHCPAQRSTLELNLNSIIDPFLVSSSYRYDICRNER